MKIKIHLAAPDSRKLFLYRFYNFKGYKFLRRFGGPLIVVIGLLLLRLKPTNNFAFENFSVYFASFAIGFGAYYTLRPFLTLLIKKNFREETTDLELRENGLWIGEEKGISVETPYANVVSSEVEKSRLFIKIMTTREAIVIVPFDKVVEGDPAEFGRALAERIVPKDKA